MTTPSPMASGPPIYKNLSLGAHMAKADKPNKQRRHDKYMIMMVLNAMQHYG